MPWLEVIAAPEGSTATRLGARLGTGTVAAGVRIEASDEGRWSGHDERHRTSLRWNGRLAAHAGPLEHGDVLQVLPSLVLRYLEREGPLPRSAALEQAIAEDPSDRQRWVVWADWLAEQSDPRAELVVDAREESRVARARRLGALAGPWHDGFIDLTWRHGFIHAATLRSSSESTAINRWLKVLLPLEPAMFIEHVHCDAFERPSGHALVASLHGAPASLGSLTIGPAPDGARPTADVATELDRLREVLPRFRTTADTLLQTFRRCVLRHGDGVLELSRASTALEGCEVTLSRTGASVTGEPMRLTVNGNRALHHRLLHGDVIQVDGKDRWRVAYE